MCKLAHDSVQVLQKSIVLMGIWAYIYLSATWRCRRAGRWSTCSRGWRARPGPRTAAPPQPAPTQASRPWQSPALAQSRGSQKECYFVLQSPVKSCASVKVSTGSRHMVPWYTPGADPLSTVSASRKIPSRQSGAGRLIRGRETGGWAARRDLL